MPGWPILKTVTYYCQPYTDKSKTMLENDAGKKHFISRIFLSAIKAPNCIFSSLPPIFSKSLFFAAKRYFVKRCPMGHQLHLRLGHFFLSKRAFNQCGQMAKLFVQYQPMYNYEILPNNIKIYHSGLFFCQILNKPP